MSRRFSRRKLRGLLPHLFLIAVSATMLFPFYWSVVMASNTMPDFYRAPPKVTPGDHFADNVTAVLQQIPFFAAMANTAIVALAGTLLVLVVDSLAAFAFAKYRFPGRGWLFGLLMLTFMLPSSLGLIPKYLIMAKLGWLGTLASLIVPAAANAFGIFWLRQYILASVPDELLDAARVDGCGFYRQWWHVGMPIMRPGLAFLGINTFIGLWNDYAWPLIVLVDPNMQTLQLALSQLNIGLRTDYAVVMAGAVIATIPLLVVFVAFAKQFISDAVAGAVKL